MDNNNKAFPASQQVCVLSYNSRGSNQQKLGFCNTLVDPQIIGENIPILCNQENFILKSNVYIIQQALPNFHLIINPTIKDTQDSGRPKNGMFIAVPDSIKSNVDDVSPGHWRIQAVTFSSENSKTLLINTYFPYDRRRQPNQPSDDESEEDLIETISIITNLITSTDCSAIVWAGDINSDFSRSSRHTGLVRDALDELSLVAAWDMFDVDFTCVYEREGETYVSTLDHFFFSDELARKVKDAGVIHHPDNPSDHSPVYCVLDSININPSVTERTKTVPKPSWRKASKKEKDHYEVCGKSYIPASSLKRH